MKTLNFKGIEYEECSRQEAVTSDGMTKMVNIIYIKLNRRLKNK